MRKLLWLLCTGLVFSQLTFAAPPAKPAVNLEPEAEQWKGKPYDSMFQFSFMPGIALLGSTVGLGLNAAVAVKVSQHGFIDDINDQAHFEIMAGPIFVSSTVASAYSVHLRWDFHKNDYWSFYLLGGLGGEVGGLLTGNYRAFHPRFGVGALWNLFEFLSFRAELSHEFTGIGIVYIL